MCILCTCVRLKKSNVYFIIILYISVSKTFSLTAVPCMSPSWFTVLTILFVYFVNSSIILFVYFVNSSIILFVYFVQSSYNTLCLFRTKFFNTLCLFHSLFLQYSLFITFAVLIRQSQDQDQGRRLIRRTLSPLDLLIRPGIDIRLYLILCTFFVYSSSRVKLCTCNMLL